MTNDQINEAIAEACGWTREGEDGTLYMTEDGWQDDCPAFCHDLNLMHKAEETLSENQLFRMASEIERNSDRFYFRATARERAEAFLRVLGKWEG